MAFRAALLSLWLGGVAFPSLALGQAIADPSTTPEVLDQAAPAGAAADPQAQTGSVDRILNWVNASGDNHGLPFIIIDKTASEVFVFDAAGAFVADAPALLGSAIGDDSAPGIGDRELSNIPVGQRTTPAGRFVAKLGTASGHEKVLWVDFTTAVSLHAVITGNKKEKRLQRLQSPTPQDNRITYGCINVPAAFYNKVIQDVFRGTIGIVYIIPETKSLSEVFASFQDDSQAWPQR
jgi:hypothetical protein